MKQKILFFALGVLCACAPAGGFLLWNARHGYPVTGPAAPVPQKMPAADDLLGTWRGKQSWGIVYTITRHSDGTFSEVLDSTKASYPWQPPVIKSSGHWSLDNARYSYYYTASTKPTFVGQGPWIRDIEMKSPSELTYREGEGDIATEEKE